MPERLQELKTYTDFLLGFLNDFLGVFLVKDLSPEIQQVVKVFSMGLILVMVLAIASFLLKFTANVLQPAAESVSQKPHYVLYLAFALLILLFTSQATFPLAVIALIVFVGINLGARYYLRANLMGETNSATNPDEGPEKDQQNQKVKESPED
jgi:hypothetical protein